MAGIGFVLRRLFRQDNLTGSFKAYFCSVFISSGPWLISVFALTIIFFIPDSMTRGIRDYQLVIIYNFSISYALYGLVSLITTRFISDSVYKRDTSLASGIIFGSFIILYALAIPCACVIYFVIGNFDTPIALSGVVNFLILLSVWHISTFLTTLSDYSPISYAFLFGMLAAVLASFYLGNKYGAFGYINGLSIGLGIILAILAAMVLAQYNKPIKAPFSFLKYYRSHWELPIIGFLGTTGIWIDKWIMWFSPDSVQAQCNLCYDIHYSSSMFLAYLTIIPSMAYFLFEVETNFYEALSRYFMVIAHKGHFKQIEESHKKLMSYFLHSSFGLLIFQGSISIIAILLAPKIISFLNLPAMQIAIFRFGVLGAFYQFFTVFFMIFLFYVDNRRAALYINTFFLLTNATLTLITIKLGFAYYGTGFFMASLLTFIFAGIITFRYYRKLVFHTFITRNAKSF